jgi:hypothetical protein
MKQSELFVTWLLSQFSSNAASEVEDQDGNVIGEFRPAAPAQVHPGGRIVLNFEDGSQVRMRIEATL